MTRFLAASLLTAVLALGAVLAGPVATAEASDVAAPFALRPAPATLPLALTYEGFKNWFMAQVMTTFSYRDRMIQMLAVGLFIGLFVMLRKMPGQT